VHAEPGGEAIVEHGVATIDKAALVDVHLLVSAHIAGNDVEVVAGENFDFEPENYAIALPKGDTELAGKINAALKKFKEDGTYDSLVKQYIEE
jgi:ABC-type amino acid transport substrate-binding protein